MARAKTITPPICDPILPKGAYFTIEGVGVAYGKKGQVIRDGRNVATRRKMKAVTPITLDVFKVK